MLMITLENMSVQDAVFTSHALDADHAMQVYYFTLKLTHVTNMSERTLASGALVSVGT